MPIKRDKFKNFWPKDVILEHGTIIMTLFGPKVFKFIYFFLGTIKSFKLYPHFCTPLLTLCPENLFIFMFHETVIANDNFLKT